MEIFTMESVLAFLTLSMLEIVLGIDNIVFLAVVTGRLPEEKQRTTRIIGLSLAMILRIGLLFAISWLMRLTEPLFTVFGHVVTSKDIVLLGGGLFLLAKATSEIHGKIDGDKHETGGTKATMASALFQIVLLDVIFSLDSVITAVGMARHLPIMIAAIVVAVGVMLVFAGAVTRFVNNYPSIQMLAFSFLMLVGVFLVAEGLGKHIDRGYIYFAMGFSLFVEIMNLMLRKKRAARSAGD